MSLSHENGFLMLIVLMMGLNALPIMSVSSTVGESCTMVVRSYNLVEFSSLGIVSVAALLITAGIFFSCQSRSAKYAELLLLLVMNLLCYAEATRDAKAWLEKVGSTSVDCHIGVVLVPLISSILMVAAMVFLCKDSR